MRRTFFDSCLFLLFLSAFAVTAFAAPYAATPQNEYHYGTVLEGSIIETTFILENRGDTPLLIDKVDTGCGCILVSHPTQILPGEEGSIDVKLITAGYGGQDLNRLISVYTNDPNRRIAVYRIQGHIDKFATISDRKVHLSGKSGKQLKKAIIIEPMDKYPFTITEIQTGKKGIVTASVLEKKTLSGKKRYEVQFENLITTPGDYTEEVYLLTDHPLQKGISINIFIRITEK